MVCPGVGPSLGRSHGVCRGHAVSEFPLLRFHGALTTVDVTSGGVALIVFGSVPLGFLTYQLYYYAYSAPSSPVLSFVHLDVAHEVRRAGTEIDDVREVVGWSVKFVDGLRLSWPPRFRIPFTNGWLRTLWLFEHDEREGLSPDALTSVPVASDADRALDLRQAEAKARISDRAMPSRASSSWVCACTTR